MLSLKTYSSDCLCAVVRLKNVLPLPLVCGTLLAALAAAPARAQTSSPLTYHLAKVIPKLLNETTQNGSPDSGLTLAAVNGQGDLLFTYASSDSGTFLAQPLVYTATDQVILLPLTGLNLSSGSSGCVPRNLSDHAADGSFRVVADFIDAESITRPVVWSVAADGSSAAPVALSNIVLPPEDYPPGEQNTGIPSAVNSSGLVVGSGNSFEVTLPLYWVLPNTAAMMGLDTYGYLTGVDEAGNTVGITAPGSAPEPIFNNMVLPVPVYPGDTVPHGIAYSVNAGLAAGTYSSVTDSQMLPSSFGFVYDSATGTALTLPYQPPLNSSTGPFVQGPMVISANGNVVGFDSYGGSNPIALWIRQSDGSYTEHGLADLTVSQPASISDYFVYSQAGSAFFLADGSLVLSGVSDPVHTLSSVTVILSPGPGTPSFFTGEASLGNGVYYLTFPGGNYFGYYSYLSDPAYLYHFDLGYEYVFDAADGNSGIYLYDFASNDFFYTSPGFPFPYLYDFGLQSTVYYYPDPNNAGHYNTDGVRYFYVFNTGQIISK